MLYIYNLYVYIFNLQSSKNYNINSQSILFNVLKWIEELL